MQKFASLISILCLTFVITACGDESTSDTKATPDVEVKNTVADWSDGEQDVVVYGIPGIMGKVSADGSLNVTLPGTLSENSLSGLLQALDLKHYGVGCSEGITVSDSSAKGAAFYALSYEVGAGFDAPEGATYDVFLTPSDDYASESSPMLFQVYSTVDTQVTGTCSLDVEVELDPNGTMGERTDAGVFNLDLRAGWNVVRLSSTYECLEGDEEFCSKWKNSGTLESTSDGFDGVVWYQTMLADW